MSEESSHASKKAISHILIWQIIVVILIVALAISVITKGFSFTGNSTSTNPITAQQAGQNAVAYINQLLAGQATATFVNASESNGIYHAWISIEGDEQDIYITKDGAMLFPGGYDMTKSLPTVPTQNSTNPTNTTTPKSDIPEVELFVMAFCPYGVQAENAMKPVADLLGDYADINVKFIVNVNGNQTSNVQSLHGAPEAMEDLRQVCIRENYNSTTFWTYVDAINKNCYSIYRNSTAMDACWKAAAATAKVNATAVESCVNTSSLTLIGDDVDAADAYGVTGSPTLIINGKTYSGARSEEGYKSAICAAFTIPPAVCGQTLNSTAGTSTGGCGG